ncbi:MAG TPA: alanine racemase [Actinomycetota bacterium]
MSGRSTWVEISTAALGSNFREVAGHSGAPVCAVVKANGYGHDLVLAGRAFAQAGAEMLGVTRIEEARALRAADIAAPVLIMVPAADPAEAVALGCEIVACSREEISSLPAGARVHLKIDTGMGRLGVRPEDAAEAARAVTARATLAGVWTHLADAAKPSGRAQVQQFADVVASLRSAGMHFVAHCANSAAVIRRPDARFDMVRVGTALYGMDPPGVHAPWTKREALTWYARVASVRTLPAGATVGYGSEWRAKAPTRVATVPVGYADGFTLEPRARTETLGAAVKTFLRSVATVARPQRSARAVLFGERRAPVVGRVAMQAATVVVDDMPDVAIGSVARIPARRVTISSSIERIEVRA